MNLPKKSNHVREVKMMEVIHVVSYEGKRMNVTLWTFIGFVILIFVGVILGKSIDK